MQTPSLAVGSIVWRFDPNHRVYKRDARGYGIGGPIYREHFRAILIADETRVSWVLADGSKINKRTLAGIYPTEADVERDCWLHEHRHHVVRLVERCDYDQLRAIAGIVGYVPADAPATEADDGQR